MVVKFTSDVVEPSCRELSPVDAMLLYDELIVMLAQQRANNSVIGSNDVQCTKYIKGYVPYTAGGTPWIDSRRTLDPSLVDKEAIATSTRSWECGLIVEDFPNRRSGCWMQDSACRLCHVGTALPTWAEGVDNQRQIQLISTKD